MSAALGPSQDDPALRDSKFRDEEACQCHTDCWNEFVLGRRLQAGRRLQDNAGTQSGGSNPVLAA